MKFILFLMLFTTAPTGPKIESKRVWALQSTSSLEFATQEACNAVGAAITASVKSVDTLTMRGWCFCESTDPNKPCPAPREASHRTILQDARTKAQRDVPAQGNVSVGIEPLTPPDLK